MIIGNSAFRNCGSIGICSSLEVRNRAYVCGRRNTPSLFMQNHFEELSAREMLRIEMPLSYCMGRILIIVKIQACWYKNSVSW